MKRNQKSGFTLIEIIVVLIILGVLAAIALPSLFSNIKKSRSAEALASLSSYKSVVEGCLQGHLGTENSCVITFTATPNFTYSFSTPPAAGSPNWTMVAAGTGNLVTADTITLTRTGGTGTSVIVCSGAGALTGAC